MNNEQSQQTAFKDMLKSILQKRWYITALVICSFFLLIVGIFGGISTNTPISGEWKELLLLLLGAFIGSYGKIIDFWFTDQDRDKMLTQKADEEDGVSLSDVGDGGNGEKKTNYSSIIPQSFTDVISNKTEISNQVETSTVTKIEIDEDGDGVMDGLDFDGDGKIDMYFEHRQCEHVWGDEDGDGEEECLMCGKIKEVLPL